MSFSLHNQLSNLIVIPFDQPSIIGKFRFRCTKSLLCVKTMLTNTFNLIIKLICFFGCSFHLYLVTDKFLAFKVETEVSFEYPEDYVLPDLELLVPLSDAINIRLFCHRYSHKFDQFFGNISTELNSGEENEAKCLTIAKKMQTFSEKVGTILTIDEIKDLLIEPKHWVKTLKIEGYPGNSLKKDLCKLNYYLGNTDFRVRLKCKDGSGSPVTIPKENFILKKGNLLRLQLNLTSQVWLSLIDPSIPIADDDSFATIIFGKEGHILTHYIRAYRVVTSYLEPPYETACKNYHRSTLFANCINAYLQTTSKPGLFPDTIVNLSEPNYPTNLSFLSLDDERFRGKKLGQIKVFKKCLNLITAPQCTKIGFLIDREYYLDPISRTGLVEIMIKPFKDPDVFYISYPVMSKVEFIIYIGSILTTWFGISILDRLQYTIHVSSLVLPKLRSINFIYRNRRGNPINCISNRVTVQNQNPPVS